MSQATETKKYEVDATGRKLGRLASELAVYLTGKNLPHYKPNQVADVSVVVKNASQLAITEKKLDEKEYARYSGYPGGRRTKTAREVANTKGYGELIRRAVEGMLPKNKLQSRRMKNLEVKE